MAVACGGGSAAPRSGGPDVGLARITLRSPAFVPSGRIPARYTCDGADVSLPLHWSGVPAQASSLTLTMRDPDAPGGNFIHWELSGLPASTTALNSGQLPPGAVPGVNGFGTKGYRGPCPPHGDPAHHYVITLTVLHGHRPIAVGSLTGIYRRR